MMLEASSGQRRIESEAKDARDAFLQAAASGDLYQVRNTAGRLLDRTDSPTRAAKLIRTTLDKAPPAGMHGFKLALLSSFSIELVHDPLIAHAASEGLALEIYQAGFDQYRQEILDPNSGLYRFQPDAVVLAIEGPRWAPELYDDFMRTGRQRGTALAPEVVDEIGDLVRTFRAHSKASVLLHSLIPPTSPALGILDANQRAGQRHLVSLVNQGLASLTSEIEGFHLVDMEGLVQSVGYAQWYDPRMYFYAGTSISRPAMDPLARAYLRYLRALTGKSRKCLVVDLDNTLWGGILGDEGPLGIKLGSDYPGNAFVAFQRTLLTLRERGILLAIASKNNQTDVDEVFKQNPAMVLKPEHFSASQIHWEPKSQSIARIAQSLNIGLEHIVLADDNPAECAEVQMAHPDVTTIALPAQPERYVEAVLSQGLFDTLSLTAEDSRRAELYNQRDEAERLRGETASLEDYYRSLDMTVYFAPIVTDSLARAAQMTQKTNQFNTTTRRYSEADLAARLGKDDWVTLTARVTDKFGNNGIVGLAMARRQDGALDVETFLMSCRVIGRTVETAMLHRLAEAAKVAGLSAIEAWMIPSARNLPVRDLYERHGFALVEHRGEETKWRLDLSDGGIALPEWLKIVDETKE